MAAVRTGKNLRTFENWGNPWQSLESLSYPVKDLESLSCPDKDLSPLECHYWKLQGNLQIIAYVLPVHIFRSVTSFRKPHGSVVRKAAIRGLFSSESYPTFNLLNFAGENLKKFEDLNPVFLLQAEHENTGSGQYEKRILCLSIK